MRFEARTRTSALWALSLAWVLLSTTGCFTMGLHFEASAADSEFRVEDVDSVVGVNVAPDVYEFDVVVEGEHKTLRWSVLEPEPAPAQDGDMYPGGRWSDEPLSDGPPVEIHSRHPNNGAPYFLRFPQTPHTLAYHDATGAQVGEVFLIEWAYHQPVGVWTVLAWVATPVTFALDVATSPIQLFMLLATAQGLASGYGG